MNLAMRGRRDLRLGPRPLALHLANSNLAWLSSSIAWPLWKNGSLPWKAELANRAENLRQSASAASADAFGQALERELRRRSDLFLRGIERYRHHSYRRAMPEMPPLWEEGTTRLLDYAPGGGAPVLVVPSLINKGYILDLAPGNSLLRYLAGQGLRPLLLDWNAPGEIEKKFGLTDYIAGRIERAREARALGALAGPFAASFAATREVPVDVLQALFTALDPLLATRKFMRFAEIEDEQALASRDFVALEDWLNDGVPLALPALARAAKLGRRAARVGFDWTQAREVRAKVVEELAELDAALGERLTDAPQQVLQRQCEAEDVAAPMIDARHRREEKAERRTRSE